jgi:hypothetical protein
MKIIITERQQNLITENMTEENLRKFLYSFWNKQKKMGKEPNLDDVIYEISDLRRNTNGDYKIIRPIWYDYNGGFDVLAEKIYEEIINKTFIITDNVPLLDTKFRVKQINVEEEDYWPLKTLNIICEVDKNGIMEYEDYDEENNEYYVKRDTIEQALYDLEYDDQGLKDYIKGLIFDVLEPITEEKYGVPVNIEIELIDFN